MPSPTTIRRRARTARLRPAREIRTARDVLDHIARMEAGAAAIDDLYVDLLDPGPGDIAKVAAALGYQRVLAEETRRGVVFLERTLDYLQQWTPEPVHA